MWTLGYTVGDVVYIAQTTAAQRHASHFSRVTSFLSIPKLRNAPILS